MMSCIKNSNFLNSEVRLSESVTVKRGSAISICLLNGFVVGIIAALVFAIALPLTTHNVAVSLGTALSSPVAFMLSGGVVGALFFSAAKHVRDYYDQKNLPI